MKYGFIKTGVYIPEIKVGDIDFNTEKIIEGIEKADNLGVELVTFPELSVTGYTCGDLFFDTVLTDGAFDSLLKIAKSTVNKQIVAVFGLPIRLGGSLYNCVAVVNNGEILGVVPKNSNESADKNYFNRYFKEYSDNSFWNVKQDVSVAFGRNLIFSGKCGDYFRFTVEKSEKTLSSCQVYISLQTETETVLRTEKHKTEIKALSEEYKNACIFVNGGEGESTTDGVYSGKSFIAETGSVIAESEAFATGLTVTDIDVGCVEYKRSKDFSHNEDDDLLIEKFTIDREFKFDRDFPKFPFFNENTDYNYIIRMQAEGLKKRLIHTHSKKLVLGLSGGLDSTLAILVAVKAIDLAGLNRKDVIALTMPCFGTTSRTFENSLKLAKCLGTTIKKIDIGKSVNRHLKDIKHKDGVLDAAFENAQARERTQILMDIANMENGLVVGTGDLSELALGFATYNGDHMSMYGVNAGIPKTLIRYIVKNYAEEVKGKLKPVLLDVLDTPVSPELLPTDEKETKQKTEDIVGPYTLHDFFIYNFLEKGYSPEKIYFVAKHTFNGEYDGETILKWLKIFTRRFFNQQFKRSCLPDGVRVGEISLSPRGAFNMPSDAVSSLWLKTLDNIKD